MTGIPQPPDDGTQPPAPDNWQWSPAGPQPGGPGPGPGQPGGVPGYPAPGYGPGAQATPYGFYPPGAAAPPPPPPRRRTGLIIGIVGGVVVLVVAVGVVLALVIGRSPKGSITLPGTLLGVSQGTGPSAQAIDRQLRQGLTASAKGKLVHPVAAVYGDPAGAAFAVAGAGICGTCAPKSVDAAKRAIGYVGVQSFSPGPNGGDLLCAPNPSQSANSFYCWWFDQKTGGYVAYIGGFASGIADAAAKTNQIRAVVEH